MPIIEMSTEFANIPLCPACENTSYIRDNMQLEQTSCIFVPVSEWKCEVCDYIVPTDSNLFKYLNERTLEQTIHLLELK